MTDQQQHILSPDGLNALYRDLGERIHVVYELTAQLADTRQQLQRVTEERDALLNQAPPVDETVTLESRRLVKPAGHSA